MAELPAEVRELFERRNFAHLATALPDGSPHSVPVWMCLEDDNPYRSAWVRGRVVDRIDGEGALEIIDRLSNQYTGADFPMRSGVVHAIEPDRSGHVVLPFAH